MIFGEVMIFITGDTHGGMDVGKLNTKNFPEGKNLTKDDYLIVTGDFGFIWDESNQDRYWLKWFQNKNFTTLFVDGNHENFDLLNAFQIEMWNGGKVHRINDSVIHLMRGQIYLIDGNKIFTFGGAMSSDIEFRKENVSWWKDEMPSKVEQEEGLKNLEVNNWEVDYIITHTCPASALKVINNTFQKDKEVTELYDFFEYINRKVKYKQLR